jgi:hypothetical protein
MQQKNYNYFIFIIPVTTEGKRRHHVGQSNKSPYDGGWYQYLRQDEIATAWRPAALFFREGRTKTERKAVSPG